MHDLIHTVPGQGRVEWIGVASARRALIEALEQAWLDEGTGLRGDHHARSGRSKRQVTLVQAEHIPLIGAWLGRPVRPEDLRRNLVISGINLAALRTTQFRIGPCVLEGTGPCAPCSRMNETLGPGGYSATRGHGGITARVLIGGPIALGAPVMQDSDWSPPQLGLF